MLRDRTGSPVGWCQERGPVTVRFNGFGQRRRRIFYTAIQEMFGHAGLTTARGEDTDYMPTEIWCPNAPVLQTVLVIAIPGDHPIWKQGYVSADAWAVNNGWYKPEGSFSFERNGGCILANPATPVKYVRSIALHEAGHILGLAHRPGAGKSVMYTYSDAVDPTRTDIQNLRVLGQQCRD